MQQLHTRQISVGKAPPGPLLLTNVPLTAVTLLMFSKFFLVLSTLQDTHFVETKKQRKKEKKKKTKKKKKKKEHKEERKS